MPSITDLSGPAGVLEGILDEPDIPDATAPHAAVVFAHPHPEFGGTMHTKAVYQGAKGLTRIGCAVLRFNFRGVGTSAGSYDEGVGEHDDFRAALDFVHDRYPGAPLWAGGMSFGSWVGLNVGAADTRVSALIGVAIALSKDYSAVGRSTTPKFFVHGERDEICSVHEVRAFYAGAAEPKELVVIDGANHLFDGKVGEVGDAIEDLLGDWGD
jgi:hypothetical protein